MFLAYTNENKLCPVEVQLIVVLWILTNFASICKFISPFLIAYLMCFLNF